MFSCIYRPKAPSTSEIYESLDTRILKNLPAICEHALDLHDVRNKLSQVFNHVFSNAAISDHERSIFFNRITLFYSNNKSHLVKHKLDQLFLVNTIRLTACNVLNLQSKKQKKAKLGAIEKEFKKACFEDDRSKIKKFLTENMINVNTFPCCEILEYGIANQRFNLIKLFIRVGLNLNFYASYLNHNFLPHDSQNSNSHKINPRELKPFDLRLLISCGIQLDEGETLIRDRQDLALVLFSSGLLSQLPRNIFVSVENANHVRIQTLHKRTIQFLEKKNSLNLKNYFPDVIVNMINEYATLSFAETFSIEKSFKSCVINLANFSYIPPERELTESSIYNLIIKLEKMANRMRQIPAASLGPFLDPLLQKIYEVDRARRIEIQYQQSREYLEESAEILFRL